MTDNQALLLMLDGDEKKVLKKLDPAGLGEVRLYFPLWPQPGGTKRTAWWAGAARWFNSLAAGTGDRVFYWGPARYLSAFLQHLDAGRGEAFVWSRWERVPAEGVSRFYGALGACLPAGVPPVSLPTHLGNRFFAGLLAAALAQVGVNLAKRGRPWPTPAEELATAKGSARLTLALIAKDEEEFLAGCLEQALPYVDDLVVVDTGSRDRTVEIARAYGAQVLTHRWDDDFAAARNAYLEAVDAGWLVTLDADEYLTPEAGLTLRRLAEKGEPKVYYLRTYNYHNESIPHFSDQANIRMTWRAADLHYTGKIHEQLQTGLPRELFGGPVVLHYGYLPSVSQRKGKLQRNAGILEEATRTGTAFDWYNKGLNLLGMNRPAEALDALEKYLAMEAPEAAQNRPSGYWHAARAALACGRQELALEYADRACQVPMPDCYFTKGQILEALGRNVEAVAAYQEAAGLPDPPASLFQLFNQSDSTIKLWRARVAAAALLEKEKRYSSAAQEYHQILQQDMTNLPALVGLARVKRLDGRPQEGVKWAKRGVEIYPQDISAQGEYLETLLLADELAAAWEHLGQGDLPAGLKGEWYLRLAGAADDAGACDLALKAAEEALKIDGGSSAALAMRARALAKLGRTAEAEALLQAAPAGPEIENERGCLALARGALDEAENYFRGVLALAPGFTAAITNLAQVLILKGRVEEALTMVYPLATPAPAGSAAPGATASAAIPAVTAASAAGAPASAAMPATAAASAAGSGAAAPTGQPASLRAVVLTARCLNSLQRFMEALNLIAMTDLVRLRPREQFELYLVQGNAYFGLEEWLAAADAYFVAYRINAEDAELLYRIGLLMLKLERWDDAANALAEALHLEPENKNARLFFEIAQKARTLVRG